MPTRRKTRGPDLPHSDTLELPDGRTLTEGDEFSVKGEGRFKFLYHFLPDGSAAAHGPVNKQTAMLRAFAPTRITTIHRKQIAR